MPDRPGQITLKGNPMTLTGREPKLGRKAPDFTVAANDLSEVKLSQFAGKVVIVSTVPSLDTPTCNIETRRFDKEVSQLGPDVVLLTVSMDLPFAQKRWCHEADVHTVITTSDYRSGDFGRKYGVRIKELNLLARAVFVIARNGKLMYQQLVPEVSSEPNYDQVLDVARALLARDKAEKPQPEPVQAQT
ncbi:MAG: thiol peroxidase [Phycisphaerae bacterium]|nr:thiol peroxidase [Phycisphaerae bacterium]